jgi:hypothetical protein
MGSRFLSDAAQASKFPFLSANLVDKKTKRAMFKSYVIKEIAGLKVGIIGLQDDSLNPILQEGEPGLVLLDPLTISKSVTNEIKKDCDLIVALSQLGESKDRKLARENPQIDLILGGGGESKRAVMERVNNIPLFRLEPRGGYLGRIDYSLVETRRPIKFSISNERDEMEKKLNRLIARSIQIKAEIAKAGKQEEMRVKELRFLESKQKELEKSLMAFEGSNFYRHTAIPVQLSIEDDPKILKGLEIYRAESAKLHKTRAIAQPEKELSEQEMIARIPKKGPFVGAISCKRCHEANYRNWLKTRHAKASRTIVASPKYAQEECLVCHSTGHGRMGEYATVEEIPFYLQGVQCESCHGEGKGHPGKKGKIERKVTLGLCRGCHTKDQSPLFNYVAYLEKIGCRITQ